MREHAEGRFGNGEAARRLGTSKNQLYRWEKQYPDFPKAQRNPRSRWRVYTEADVERIRAWMNVDLVDADALRQIGSGANA